ncbi:hypothetical protein [Paenibacillus sp. SN-8-1]|uniref:hypothetical protein n=1 Tax=Paenibacillus sp. SN-8-1 TaxID=3435409 RepID=UPI003D9A711D
MTTNNNATKSRIVVFSRKANVLIRTIHRVSIHIEGDSNTNDSPEMTFTYNVLTGSRL